jgi:alpha-L-fucosidase 2
MDDLVLRWPRPATTWFEAAPVGNGRLGAMVFGGAGRARFQVNDATVWSPRRDRRSGTGTTAGPGRC